MASVQATGRVTRDRHGLELIIERRLVAPADEVWEWLTVPARTRKWIGAWKGKPAVGAELSFTMTFADDPTPRPITVRQWEPGYRFAAEYETSGRRGHLGFSLAEIDGVTRLYFTQRLATTREAGSAGPGWEYYLDRLVAAHTGAGMPSFRDYFPAQRPYYERLAMDGDPRSWPPS